MSGKHSRNKSRQTQLESGNWCPANKAGQHLYYKTSGGYELCARCGHRK